MRIFTRKSFGFVNPDPAKEVNGAKEIVRTSANAFQDVPEWVKEDDMFKWAVADGDIEVIDAAATAAIEKAKAEGKAAKKEEWK